ncbi:glucose-6-phosphate dehydrogenase [Corallococcus sp. AB049A]|uniref:glucose-6-phosphate dehydrogenase n=1 Tax=Corallococcus sp. AB049A TaxID=2316721 RepID=UPI000EA2DB36|nr:glucose-6-phosphate dehydrogenase [Corallococcus sp. AB049A]RKH53696.1 glucose-6-phosphate dehydrogenase [Corallococcus sp. AB050B]RKI60827.1 glucose-6-phosphate dehydrogenase [Corallococcus sp. AB049A]
MDAQGVHIETHPREGEPVFSAGRPDPCTLVLFGATGDLAERKLFPALFELARAGLLPENFAIVAYSRSKLEDGPFREHVKEGLKKFARTQPLDEAAVKRFTETIETASGGYDDPEAFKLLGQKLQDLSKRRKTDGNQLYYMATPASTFPQIIQSLSGAGLLKREEQPGQKPWHRLIIEKPFGHDLESAKALNKTLGSALDEKQIFRIDHYLGKETVQNILVFRFANAIFEPLWNRQHIDHVEITAAEAIGVEGRGGFYDETGVIRDMVQNHLLQVLALCAMEPPVSFAAEDIRDEKNKVFRALRPVEGGDVPQHVVVGQYEGYQDEKGVTKGSRTPTYVAMKMNIDSWRWQGVPFYLRAGKNLKKRLTEVSIHFKTVPLGLFSGGGATCQRLQPNVLTLRIQPHEGIALSFESKIPGEDVNIGGVTMDMDYAESFKKPVPEAYERLLLDCMRGNATLFARQDSVEQAWGYITPILKALETDEGGPVHTYARGSKGPDAADALPAKNGRRWSTL